MIDTEAEVETPEQIRFRYRVAGPAHRAVAYAIDLLVRAAVLLLVGMAFGLASYITEGKLAGVSTGMILLVLFALEWGYYVLFETLWNGQSLGKRALGLRVVNRDGYAIQFMDSVLRNLLRAADFLPFGYAIGLFCMAGDRCFRRLGDRVAETMVVLEERRRVALPVRIVPPPTPEEIESFAQRPRLEVAEREALEMFLRRRGTLGLERERELAEMVAPAYRERLGIAFHDPVRFLALLYTRATEREDRGAAPKGPGR